jgi:hypothetical protein
MVKRKRLALRAGHLYRQEIKMNISLKTAISVGLVLVTPLLALPAQGAPMQGTAKKPAHHQAHQMRDFANARALAGPAPSVFPAHETDGLSRNAEECSRGGCIDN